jgi:uncharacterized membrane protein YbhN (UPF0104 family)
MSTTRQEGQVTGEVGAVPGPQIEDGEGAGGQAGAGAGGEGDGAGGLVQGVAQPEPIGGGPAMGGVAFATRTAVGTATSGGRGGWRRVWRRAWRALVALALFAALFAWIGVEPVLASLRHVDPLVLVGLVLLQSTQSLCAACRWRACGRLCGVVAPFPRWWAGIYLTQLVSQCIPSALLADLSRFGLLAQGASGTPPLAVARAIVCDRVVNAAAVFLVCLCMAPLLLHLAPSRGVAATILAMGGGPPLLVLGVLALDRGRRRGFPGGASRGGLTQGLKDWLPRLAGAPLLWSLAILSLVVAGFGIAAAAVGLSPLPIYLPWIPLVVALTSLAPVSISDWGVRESAALWLLVPLGATPATVLALGLTVGAGVLLGALPGLAILLYAARQR